MNQREKILVGAAVVIALLFGVPVAIDAFSATQNTEAKIAQLRRELKVQEADRKDLNRKIKELKPQVQMIAWNLPPDRLRQEMVRKIANIAQTSGATLVTTRPLKPRNLDVVTEVSVDLHLTTPLPTLVKFLHPLQQPSSRMSVDKVRISSTNAENDLLDVDLTVSAYTLQLLQEAKTASTQRSQE